MAKKARCPVCKESFELESDLEVGDILNCSECSAELRLTKHSPLRVEEVVFWDDYKEKQQDEEEEEDSN